MGIRSLTREPASETILPIRGACIGAGNVATILSKSLSQIVDFRQVYSRTDSSAHALADSLGCESLTDPAAIDPTLDFYLVSLADSAIESVVKSLPITNGGVWVHTSGTIPATVLQRVTDNYGVFYPLQTFSKGQEITLVDIPFFIEGSNRPTTDFLINMARKLSDKVYEADTSVREVVHIAGVMSCNFTTMLLNLTQKILSRKGIPLDVVEPLVKETIRKSFATSPKLAQTGPARRGDTNVINHHLEHLSGVEEEVYSLMSRIIQNEFKS